MKERTTCSICGAKLDKEHATEFDGKVLCAHCLSERTFICDCYETRVWNNELEGDSNISLCRNCYKHYYTHCECCDRIVANEDANYVAGSDNPYCEICYDRFMERPIKPYHYKTGPIFCGSGNLFMGVELEIDKGGEVDDNAKATYKNAKNKNNGQICGGQSGK